MDGNRLYALSVRGDLVCLEAATGKEVWHKDYKKDFGGRNGNWGFTESVLIDGDKLVCTPGGPKDTLVALDKKSGMLIWSCTVPGVGAAGYSSIVMSEAGGVHQYVQQTADNIIGVQASDGTLLWTYKGIGRNTANIPTCIVHDEHVFCDAGYGKGGTTLKITHQDGKFSAEELYPVNRQLENKHGGIVLVNGHLYGDKGDSGRPWCADFLTGKTVPNWCEEKPSGSGSMTVTYADGYLYCLFASGDLALVKATPDGYHEASTFKVPHKGTRPCWAHMAIIGGRLYVRVDDWVMCYELKAQ